LSGLKPDAILWPPSGHLGELGESAVHRLGYVWV